MDAQELRAELEGTLVDRYQIEHDLGAGGMARVFAARDLRHQRRVAIKVLRAETAAVFGAERFLREINLTANLQHPHILPLLDSGTITVRSLTVPYYVMPLVAGLSLRVRLDLEGKLPWQEALRLIGDVGEALAFAHEHGIVHRDIKPENLLLSESGAIQVADFGVARILTTAENLSLTEEGVSVGTPLYMSPEQAFGDGEVGAKSDQYSLATVFFELVTGEAPYYAPSKEAILARRLVEPLPSPLALVPTLPAGFEPVLHRAMARRPDDRFPTVTEFVQALERATESPTHARAGGWLVRSTPRSARRWLVGGATVLAIAAGLTYAVRRGVAKPASRPVVAVLTFENLTRDSLLDPVGRVTADWIVQGVAESGMARVVSQQTTVLGEQKDQAVNGADPEGRAQRIGQILGASLVVTGGYRLIGDSLGFTVRLVDPSNGEVKRAMGPIQASRVDPSQAADQVRQRVLGALGVTIEGASRSPSLAKIGVAPSYLAYREYLRALDLDNGVQTREAMQAALHAYRLDTTFLLPLTLVVGDLYGQGDLGEMDSILKVVEGRSAELSPIERATFDSYRSVLKGDLQAAVIAQRRADSIAPSDQGKYDIAAMEFLRNRIKPALALLDQCNTTNGLMVTNEEFWITNAVMRHRLGRYDEALDVLRRGRKFLPATQGIDQAEIAQLVALGRETQVDSALAVVRQLPDQDVSNLALVWGVIAGELRVHGFVEHGRQVARKGLDLIREVDRTKPRSMTAGTRMYLLMELERWSEVAPLADSVRRLQPTELYFLGTEAVALIHLGRPAAADSLLAEMMTARFGGPGDREFTMARVAASRGTPDQAVAWLQRALASGFPAAHINFHQEYAFQPLRGRPDFEAAIRPRE